MLHSVPEQAPCSLTPSLPPVAVDVPLSSSSQMQLSASVRLSSRKHLCVGVCLFVFVCVCVYMCIGPRFQKVYIWCSANCGVFKQKLHSVLHA